METLTTNIFALVGEAALSKNDNLAEVLLHHLMGVLLEQFMHELQLRDRHLGFCVRLDRLPHRVSQDNRGSN